MKNKVIKSVTLMICFVLILLICSSCTRQNRGEQENLFPVWQSYLPFEPEVVCIVQCEPIWLEYKGERSLAFSRHFVKTYSDKNQLRQIVESLFAPEIPGHNELKSGRCLLVVSVANRLNSQTAVRVPFDLGDDGYAIIPTGRDRQLYNILHSALIEWDVQKKAESKVEWAIGFIAQYSSLQYRDDKKITRDGFQSYLKQKNEDPNIIINTLSNYYSDPNFLENWYKERPIPSKSGLRNTWERMKPDQSKPK